MKKKIFSILAVFALTASFALPALVSQNAWAEGAVLSFCLSKGGHQSSDGKTCSYTEEVTSRDACNGKFTAPTSSSQGKMYCTITVQVESVDSQLTEGSTSINQTPATESSPSKTADSSGASSAQESSPDQMQKTGGCKDGQVYTSILGGGGCVDIGKGGDLIFSILNTVLTILTYGVGIAGTLGIVISGIQYLTARDNEAQLTKAKSRLVNIIIGLAAYALLWAFLQWLIPGGLF